jgi:hypothetical protein
MDCHSAAQRRNLLLILLSIVMLSCHAQSFENAPRTYVTMLPQESTQVAPNKPVVVDVHFRVAGGLHINSHTPTAEYLIPTTLTLEAVPAVQWGVIDYPAGELRSFPFSPGEKLSVYTGDVTLHLHLKARPGMHLFNGTLRFQACDNRACYPPKTVPVQVLVDAK